ncbi:helix-turn-helix domain-containing protein [Costertonia aggregata]|uniref:Helix-turn-helix transcriptional regulator n=1 Tax=Costertonia aggregata TaxID=343403 RepID=A0A7H9AN73_9FLAO|nr:helix-turn-helix transcriptional regulator [Costertonia aggregata]QLG44880.1 helix-turn-helix transcriptional regulator [Costertonia aggregata]
MKQPALGNKITELRKQKGLTQEELVERCNINVRTLQRIENGEVSPRSYTIKTILSALDHDYEELYGSKEENDSNIINSNSKNEVKTVRFLLTLAGISGILYLISGPFEAFADISRFGEDELIFGLNGHITIKIISYLSYALMAYGFLITGRLLKNYLMKIASVLLIIVLLLFYIYDVASLFFNTVFPVEGILIAESIIVGTLGMLFGISIIKSAKRLGTVGYAAGGLEILASVCFLTVILAPIGLFVQFAAILMEVIFLFKTREMVKYRP